LKKKKTFEKIIVHTIPRKKDWLHQLARRLSRGKILSWCSK